VKKKRKKEDEEQEERPCIIACVFVAVEASCA